MSRLESLRAPRRGESFRISQQSSDGFAPVASRATELVVQLRLRPWWLAPGIPLGQHLQRLLIVEREPAREATADSEGMDVSVLACNRRWHGGHVTSRSLDYWLIEVPKLSGGVAREAARRPLQAENRWARTEHSRRGTRSSRDEGGCACGSRSPGVECSA
jgi:hypothetical protein